MEPREPNRPQIIVPVDLMKKALLGICKNKSSSTSDAKKL